MAEKPTWQDRLRYKVDNTFSRGSGALILWLGVLSLGVVLLSATILVLAGFVQDGEMERLSFIEAVWGSLMRTLDPGTMGGDTGWGFRLVMLVLPTLGGIFIISTLIGVLTSAIDGKIEELQKGRSKVIENNHTVILGWNEQVFTIVTELAIANQNVKDACIVILGERDKVEMEDELRAKADGLGRTRLVCRTGSPIEAANLEIVSIETARSIIVLSPDSDDPDAEVIKTILAITNHPGRRTEPYHIVAELRDPKNAGVAKVVGSGEVEWIQVGEFVARIIAQTCRQSGLSVIYTELLNFAGDEIYFAHLPELDGTSFGACLNRFNKNTVLGVYDGHKATLNPPMERVLGPQDQLVVIAADDDQIFLDGKDAVQDEIIQPAASPAAEAESTLILGWNWRAPAIIRELDQYVAPGSQVTIVADPELAGPDLAGCCGELTNQEIEVRFADTSDRRTLDGLDLDGYDHLILLCYSDRLNAQQADARTLITLLHLRDIAQSQRTRFSIVSEMLDIRNRNLADITRADDFIVSDKLVSLMLAQVAENKHLNAVFTDLFDPAGSEIYLKPADWYMDTRQPVNFYTIVEAARRRGEVAIGYRLRSQAFDPAHTYGITLNPSKDAAIQFGEGDKIIVIAEA